MKHYMFAVAVATKGKKPDVLIPCYALHDALVLANELLSPNNNIYIIDSEAGIVIYEHQINSANEVQITDCIKRNIFLTIEELGYDYNDLL